ncbi:hypothetical protein PRK78_001191 [Emydomyces testavorans]|uniref:Uncharacterized protein n=1 Tax=Emydomyces testavorans TaxID=2070801 RepID=A0AAF0DCI1_9EURO|nr:hypothetical protein PRK78_001191 [Emydomyces testavorans]
MPIPLTSPSGPANSSGDKASKSHSDASSSCDSQSSATQSTTSSATSETEHGTGRGEQLSKEEADRLYEERMEEEYAKREGGANYRDGDR